MGLRSILIITVLFTGGLLHAQLAFTELPVSLQQIARSAPASGSFAVAGTSRFGGACQIKSRLSNSSSKALVEEKLSAPDAFGAFYISHTIPAQIAEYDLAVYLSRSSGDSLIKLVSRLVCGDYFIIAGQSNALAAAEPGDTVNMRPWLRGIGTHDNPVDPAFPCAFQNLGFYEANTGWIQNGFVGTWGLKLAYDLSRHTGIPACMINGARAGSTILQNLPGHTPSDVKRLDSCSSYDRLYLKVTHHRLNSAIRALFWYQGEADGSLSADSVCAYFSKFNALYTAWKTDYPNLEKIFLMQVNTGCTDRNLSLLREIERQISYRYPDIVIMSTFSQDTADRTSDICHYTPKGYRKLAEKMLPLVKKYIYNAALNEDEILPPKVVKVYSQRPAQLCIEFDKAVSIQQSFNYAAGTAYLKDYFYGEGDYNLGLESVASDGNNVFLNFKPGDLMPANVTYAPQSYSRLPSLYTGPWIINAKNPDLTALSFCNFPVTSGSSSNNWSGANHYGACGYPDVVPETGFLAYPSPAKDLMTIHFPEKFVHANTVSLIDSQGKLIQQLSIYDKPFMILDVSAYEKGIYLLKLNNANGTFLKKIVVDNR